MKILVVLVLALGAFSAQADLVLSKEGRKLILVSEVEATQLETALKTAFNLDPNLVTVHTNYLSCTASFDLSPASCLVDGMKPIAKQDVPAVTAILKTARHVLFDAGLFKPAQGDVMTVRSLICTRGSNSTTCNLQL